MVKNNSQKQICEYCNIVNLHNNYVDLKIANQRMYTVYIKLNSAVF